MGLMTLNTILLGLWALFELSGLWLLIVGGFQSWGILALPAYLGALPIPLIIRHINRSATTKVEQHDWKTKQQQLQRDKRFVRWTLTSIVLFIVAIFATIIIRDNL